MVDVSKSLAGGQNFATYPETTGNEVKFYHLSSDPAGSPGAFHDMEQAITDAKLFVFIADWSFHPNTRLRPSSPPTATSTIGHLLNQKAKAGLVVAIHTWDHTNAAAHDDQNDSGAERLDIIARLANPKDKRRSANLLWRASSRKGVGWSLHQKFVVLDAAGPGTKRCIKAFLGGLDITRGRYELPGYPVDAAGGAVMRAKVPVSELVYDDWYNAEFERDKRKPDLKKSILGEDKQPGQLDMPRQPWEDYHVCITGPSAWDILREFVGRWERDEMWYFKTLGDNDKLSKDKVLNLFTSLFDKTDVVHPWEPGTGPFTARIIRSLELPHWGPRDRKHPPLVTGKKDKQTELTTGIKDFEHSIQESYLRSIAQADRFIYIENQYLIGSGAHWSEPRGSVKNQVPEAIVQRIVSKINSNSPFHVYVVVPMFPEGPPLGGASPAIRRFEWLTMEYMAKSVYKAANAKGKNWYDYLSFYCMANWTTGKLTRSGDRKTKVQSNNRYMVYVHSKMMIIDDEFMIIGSANLNERSLAGDRDAEIGAYFRASDGQLSTCKDSIQKLRKTAWTRHLGTLPPSWDKPEQPACVSSVQSTTVLAYISMRGRLPSDCRLIALPFHADESSFYFNGVSIKEEDSFILDAPNDPGKISGLEWMWASPFTGAVGMMDLGE